MRRRSPWHSGLFVILLAGAACQEPIEWFGPREPSLLNPQITEIGLSSGFPDG